MSASKIPWCDKTWSPFTGCNHCSPGCDHCYAKVLCWRFAVKWKLPAKNPFAVTWHQDWFDRPDFGKPCRVFVGPMTDLFHPDVSTELLDMVLKKIAYYKEHTFIVLTKRPELMEDKIYGVMGENFSRELGGGDYLPNLWFGVSVCAQDEIWKISKLMEITAAKRFVSFEPLLGRIQPTPEMKKLDWIIAGGETGPGARECDTAWISRLAEFGQENKIPFFFKGWGSRQKSRPWTLPRQFPKRKDDGK